MLVNILAAIVLQTSPILPADCSLNGNPPVACQVQIHREEGYVGIGFAIPGGTLLFGGHKVDRERSTAQLVSINDTTYESSEGACLIRDKVLGCSAVVNGQTITIVAQVR